MRRSHVTVADARTTDSLELTRRLYRGVTDIAKRLDEQRVRALSAADIFTPSGEALRAKLRDYCERLIFKDPVDHARKTEELLWRRGFYDTVSTAKKLRKGNTWNETEKALLSAHLAVGVGFYHHLILRLQLECGLELVGVIDFAYPQNEDGLSNSKHKPTQSKMHMEEVRQCAIRLIHRSLTCLGDLARYRLDLDPNWDPKIATRYYKMAIVINPNIGMPHNQLGTVAGNKNYGLDAVYHYMRCMLCPEPFEGAEGNSKRMVTTYSSIGREEDPVHRCIARLLSLLQLWNSDTPNPERINQACEDLLTNVENCLTIEEPEPNTSRDIVEEDKIEDYLKNCKNEQPTHLTNEMIFQILAICLMSIFKLQTKESSEVQGVIAFTLAILSQLLQFTITRLQESLIDMALPNGEGLVDCSTHFIENSVTDYKVQELLLEASETDIENEKNLLNQKDDYVDLNDNKQHFNCKDGSENLDDFTSQTKIKARDKSKNLLTKLRRPRRRRNSSDSDASDVDINNLGSSSDELNSDISETAEDVLSEEIVLSDDGLSEDLSDDEGKKEVGEKENAEEKLVNGILDDISKREETRGDTAESISSNGGNLVTNVQNDDKDSITNSGSAMTITTNVDSSSAYDESSSSTNTIAYVAQMKKQSLDPNDVLNVLTGEGMLASIKISYDWLRSNPDIMKTCARSSKTLLKRITTLLNLINVDADVLLKKWGEDTVLLSSEKLEEYVKKVPLPEDIDLRGLKIFKEASKDLDWKFLRKCRLTKREETLLRTLKLVKFGHFLCSIEDSGVTYDETKRLFVSIDPGVSGVLIKGDSKIEDREMELEHPRGKLMRHMGRLWLRAEVRDLESRVRSRLMSPYLVPDHEALAKHTPALKRLVYAKRFIVVIPSVVVSALDEVKRTSGRAREATRWLEAQFRRGSRFLRAQRPHERLPIPLLKGPSPKDKEAWLYFQVIECCHYLTQQTRVSLTSDQEAPVVTLLTGCNTADRKSTTFSPVGLAKSAGVNLEHIESFHTKWKASSKSHG